MAKRALLMLATVFVFLFGVGSTAVVQAQDGAESPFSPQYDANLTESYREAITNCGTPSLECLVHHVFKYVQIETSNTVYQAPPPSVGNGSVQSVEAQTSRGVAGGLMYLIGQMYANPPASTGTYVADVMNSANIATPAYAQGLGFAALDPILSLWKTFRNIAYIFFVVIFVIIGFMIMFRNKVNGADITAQQAIPSIIVSLIFVTFSYAIAGFLIDIMYLIMFLMIGLFDTNMLQGGQIIDFNILQIGAMLFSGVGTSFSNNIDIVTNMLSGLVNSQALADTFGIVGGVTLSLVLAVAVIIGTFKLFFELLKSYANVIVSTVIGPITLMMGAMPGKNVFVPWVRNIAGNLAAFPTVLFIVILYNQFTELGSATTGGFMPPFLLGRGQSGAIASLMGLALILAMPEIVKEVKTMVGATEGLGTKVFGWATQRAKQAPRYGFPVYGAAGEGTIEAVKGGWQSRGNGLGNMLSGAREGFGKGARSGLKRGQNAARTFEQITEGKFLDPNSWENVILARERAEQLKLRREQLENEQNNSDQDVG